MNQDDFKKLLDKSLKPIKQDLNGVKQDLNGVKEELKGVKETLKDHTQRLEALAGDVHDLKDQTKAIWDKVGMGHDRNKREIDEIKTHLGMPVIPDVPQV